MEIENEGSVIRKAAVNCLLSRIHPDAVEQIRINLIQTLTRQIATRRNDLHELEELHAFAEREAANGPLWATW